MPFNSNTYRMNKYRRQALEALAAARTAPDWTSHTAQSWAASRVTVARALWRSYLSCRRVGRMNADLKSLAPADFIAKWSLDR